MGYEPPLTGAQRVAKRRAALRAQGLRPKTFWLPDTRTPEFKEQARLFCEMTWREYESNPEIYRWAEAMADEVIAELPLPWDDDET